MISVVICVRNGAATVREQLDALAAQVGAPPFEVVIVDNGSTDGTAPIVQEWMRDGIGAVAEARLVSAPDQAGLAFARNVGAASSRGEILAFCDADDIVGPRWVCSAATLTDSGPRVATGPIFELGADGQPARTLFNGIDESREDAGLAARFPFARGCNIAMTRSAFQEVGGFDGGLPAYGSDDTELGLRLARAGIRIHFIDGLAVAYRLTKGWRRRLRRKYRAGVAQSVQWARHPDAYLDPPSTAALVRDALVVPLRVFREKQGTIRTRALRGAEEAAFALGAARGTQELAKGRWAEAELYDPLEHRRPEVRP